MSIATDDKATTTVEESITVKAPLSEVYNQWTQFEDFPKFMDGVEEITQVDDTHNHWRAKVGNVEREFDTEITEQKADDRIAWKSIDGKTHAGAVSFYRLSDEETKITLQMDWAPEGAIEKIGSALNFDDRQIKHDLSNFKDLIEAHDGNATGAWRGEVKRPDEAGADSTSGIDASI
jgi:uncharacterized membrane protein